MNYAEMSDFEINKAVAVACGYAEENCDFGWTGKPDVGVEWNEETGYPTKSFNYCNSWADAGPIIEQHGIGIMPLKRDLPKAWDISAGLLSNTDCKHKNILRAAMIVFLMKQEKANA